MKRTPNYKLKGVIIQESDQLIVHKYDNLDYKKVGFLEGLDIERAYIELLGNCGLEYIRECRRINNAFFARKKRLKQRIIDLIHKGTCIFVTLKFKPDVLANTNEETRRKYVQRYLKSKSDFYVANIDYGVDDRYTHAEHYHAIVLSDFVENEWEYGFSWHERVRTHTNPKRLAYYITKLTNHAIKDSTRRCCYIYSRNK